MFFLFGGFSLWQDSQNRVYLIKELDRRTGQVSVMLRFCIVKSTVRLLMPVSLLQIAFPALKFCILALELQGQSAISVDETLKVVACR